MTTAPIPLPPPADKITADTVRADFNDPLAVVHYARAAHFLGLWRSERLLIERFFPERSARLIEAGCGAGRVTLGLWDLGYHQLTAFDFAEELLDQARHLAIERGASAISFLHADATALRESHLLGDLPAEEPKPVCNPMVDKLAEPRSPAASECSVTSPARSVRGKRAGTSRATSKTSAVQKSARPDGKTFAGALFLFNGLMQIPGRENRRAALRELHAVCAPGAPLLFTTHDRDHSPVERALWRLETLRWESGVQDPRLVEFGDRYFADETGRTFMHLPDRAEILADLAATGWSHEFDALRHEVAREPRAVREFSDECRFWAARRPGPG